MITDLTNTEWLINDFILVSSTTSSYYINFWSCGIDSWSPLTLSSNGISYNDVTVATVNGNKYNFININYRLIKISGGDDVTNTELIDWLVNNATRVRSYNLFEQIFDEETTHQIGTTAGISTHETEKTVINYTPEEWPYIFFRSENGFTLYTNNNTKNWDGIIEYSINKIDWTEWDGTEISSALNDTTNKHYIYLRGRGNTKITGVNSNFRWVLSNTTTGTNIECWGSLEYLLDYTIAQYQHPRMADYCYNYMFYDCTSLTKAPTLSATTLTESCYGSMFEGCTGLTLAPALPATTLATYCYSNMFKGCTGLTSAPVLPATTLATYCYNHMFNGCTGLTSAPILPATTLASYCYRSMFYGCIGLTSAPILSATTLANGCYYGMFWGCANLTTAPTLSALNMVNYCYNSMFKGCTSLLLPPALPGDVQNYCYQSMFEGCTSLTTLPILPSTVLSVHCYDSMFKGCTAIKLSKTSGGEYTYSFRMPPSGFGITAVDALKDMFTNTGGSFTGRPVIMTTYYTNNQPIG